MFASTINFWILSFLSRVEKCWNLIFQSYNEYNFPIMKIPSDFPTENNLFQSRLALRDDNTMESVQHYPMQQTYAKFLNDDKSKRAKYYYLIEELLERIIL